MRIELFEWSISPDPFEVAPGIYRAEVVNMGRRAHDLIVAGETEIQTRRLNPGQTQMVTFVLKAGETPMWCSIGDHRDMGMEAYIQVN